MTRYVTKAGLWRAPQDEEWPRASWEPTTPTVTHPTVYEAEEPVKATGLVDAGGNAIYRDGRRKVGYL